MDEPSADSTPSINPERVEALHSRLLGQQNLLLGILAGFIAALLGAIVWTVITVVTNYQIGFMAVGVGFLVGYAVRQFGKGITKVFGFAGAVLALFGCLLGNLLTACEYLTESMGIPYGSALAMLDLPTAMALLEATFSPMDLLFYAIAIYEGYRLSFHQVGPEEIAALHG